MECEGTAAMRLTVMHVIVDMIHSSTYTVAAITCIDSCSSQTETRGSCLLRVDFTVHGKQNLNLADLGQALPMDMVTDARKHRHCVQATLQHNNLYSSL